MVLILTQLCVHCLLPFGNVEEEISSCSITEVRALHHQVSQRVASKIEFMLPPWQKKARFLVVDEHLWIVWIRAVRSYLYGRPYFTERNGTKLQRYSVEPQAGGLLLASYSSA